MTADTGIRVELLGRLDVLRDGARTERLLAQPRRVALLACLLLRRAGGPVPADDLAALLWPDADGPRARASLRQAVRFLRVQLGDHCVLRRGEDALEVAGGVWCDALEVSRALAQQRDRQAVDGYGGELLAGWHLPGLPELDHWLDGERERLRSGVLLASLRLADAAAGRGRSVEARQYLQRALDFDPGNEAAARRAMTLHAEAGDAAAAAAVFETLRRALAALDSTPSAATVALHQQILDGSALSPGAEVRGTAPRVVVAQLENLTGLAALDVLGRLAADTIAQGLAQVPDVDVAPPLPAAAGTPAELAARVGARVVVEGTYVLEGSELVWQVQLTELPQARLLPSPAPVTGAAASPREALMRLRDDVVRLLAPVLSTRATHSRHSAPPPTVQAYAAYVDGLDHFVHGEWRRSLESFARASALEPDYVLPQVVSAISLWNLGELRQAKRAVAAAEPRRAELSRFDRALLDMVSAWLAGDWAGAYRATRVQAELAPSSIPHFGVAEEAYRLNRPREAIEVLGSMDPESGELKGWIYYWVVLTEAHHVLGEHREELELTAACERLYPGNAVALALAARAHAALGDERSVQDVADAVLGLPGRPDPTAGEILLEAGLELRAHGHAHAADHVLARALAWHREQADASAHGRRGLALALYHAGHLAEAGGIFRELVLAPPPPPAPLGYLHRHLQAQLDQGYLLLIASALGDEAEAARLREVLRDMEGPFLFGAQWFYLAADAAARGARQEAVTLLRRAFADGLPFQLFLHADPHLAPLRGFPAFDALMRPKG